MERKCIWVNYIYLLILVLCTALIASAGFLVTEVILGMMLIMSMSICMINVIKHKTVGWYIAAYSTYLIYLILFLNLGLTAIFANPLHLIFLGFNIYNFSVLIRTHFPSNEKVVSAQESRVLLS